MKKGISTPLLIWLLSCLVFHSVIFLNRNIESSWDGLSTALLLLSPLAGAVSFLALLSKIRSISKDEKMAHESKKLALLITTIFFLFFVPFLFMPYKDANQFAQKATPVKNQPKDIECFVNGLPVTTTRENCRELSKKQDSPAPVQVIQQRKIEIPDPPKVKLPTRTNCRAKYDILGNYVGTDCATY